MNSFTAFLTQNRIIKWLICLVLNVLMLLHCNSNVMATTCFNCTQIKQRDECNQVMECGAGYLCYSSNYYLGSDLSPLWDFGCKPESFCGLIKQPGSSLKRRENKASICNDCCRGEFCNLVSCDPGAKRPTKRICHSCKDVSDPGTCQHTERCADEEICAVWEIIPGHFSLGCKPKSTCLAEGNNLLFGKRNINIDNDRSFHNKFDDYTGYDYDDTVSLRRDTRQSPDEFCRQCCDGDLCANVYCSRSKTLPQNAVTVTLPPTTTTTKRPLSVKLVPSKVSTFEKDNATFSCVVEGNNPPYQIYFSRAFSSNLSNSAIDSCNSKSSLPSVSQDCSLYRNLLTESGIITCLVIDNTGQTKAAEAIFEVEKYVNNFKVVDKPVDIDIKFSETEINTKCSMTGFPKPHYEWYKNVSGTLQPITDDINHIITNDKTSSTLQIKRENNFNLDGSYLCRGNNFLEVLDLPFNLNAITKVLTITPLSNKNIDIVTKEATFECGFRSYPASTITLTLITASNQVVAISPNKGNIVTTTDDRETKTIATIAVDFLVTNQVKYILCTGTNGYSANYTQGSISLLKSPLITTPIKYYNATYGQFFTIRCDADGIPDPVINWSFVDLNDNPTIIDGVDIKDNGRVLQVAHMRIGGKFMCFARNAIGQDTKTFTVSVS